MSKAKIDPTTAMLESARRAAERDEAAKEKGFSAIGVDSDQYLTVQEPAAAKEEPSAATKRRAKSSGRVATTIYLDAETKRNIDRIILERKWAGETDASMALYIREAVAKQLAEDLAE